MGAACRRYDQFTGKSREVLRAKESKQRRRAVERLAGRCGITISRLQNDCAERIETQHARRGEVDLLIAFAHAGDLSAAVTESIRWKGSFDTYLARKFAGVNPLRVPRHKLLFLLVWKAETYNFMAQSQGIKL